MIHYTLRDKARSGKHGTSKNYRKDKLSLLPHTNQRKLKKQGAQYCKELGIRQSYYGIAVYKRNGHIIKRTPVEILNFYYNRVVRSRYNSLDLSLRNNRVTQNCYDSYRVVLGSYRELRKSLQLPKLP